MEFSRSPAEGSSTIWAGGALSESELLRRWDEALLAAGCHAEAPQRTIVGRELLAHWREAHRHYHDLEHLSEVLRALDALGVAPGAVQLAAFFHDAVYRGHAIEDETESAGLATRLLTPLLAGHCVEAVSEHVRSTADHQAGTAEGQALNDADLAILASPRERYGRYVAGVRSEYAQYTDEAFSAGRSALLQDLMRRPRLFLTDTGFQLWERNARDNVAAELAGHDSA